MNKKTIGIAYYVTIIIILGFIIISNKENVFRIIIVSTALIALAGTRNASIYDENIRYKSSNITILFDIALVYWLIVFDKTSLANIYLFIIMGEAIITNSFRYSIGIACISFISYMWAIYVGNRNIDIINMLPIVIKNIILFIIYNAVFYVAKYQMDQKKKLEETTIKLRKTLEELEDMIILEERNRIAREIHDTVGHTLTTVLIEIEAGKRLIERDNDLAREKLDLAQSQVRNGLDSIRHSVRLLKQGEDVLDFLPSLISLIDETKKHTGIDIHYNIDCECKVPNNTAKSIYRFLQEGITNGIKHGNSTIFNFKLILKDDYINFYLRDNGKGSDDIVYGFGLTSMRERVEKIDGSMNVKSKTNEGFLIKIKIPFYNEESKYE